MVGDRRKSVDNYNNDYLAERSRRRRAVLDHEHGRIVRTGRRSNQITDISTLCNASRSVDGGVDSQA